ncbi:serine/arginine repetitive matrix protein 1 [Patella vulgata]|uniref:serine/arginine repetitive matrix protein 1 n=1 Tax=Patella vulgata TaxID=6465 RepID=UPI00217FDA23|nr:serine/arginine repetitive matrix protein 1 [Patella vulgata]
MEDNERDPSPKAAGSRYRYDPYSLSEFDTREQMSKVQNKKDERSKESKKIKQKLGEPGTKQRSYKPKKTASPSTDSSTRNISGMALSEHSNVSESETDPDLPNRNSSFSSRISPSRLTSQMFQALNREDNCPTSKLHSALTGKLQPHPHLRDTPQSMSPVRVPSPARHPSPGGTHRSTPPMSTAQLLASQFNTPLGIKVSPDFHVNQPLRISPGGRISPRGSGLPPNLPTLSPNLPSTSPRSDPARNSPGPPRLSGPYSRPDHHPMPFPFVPYPSDPMNPASVRTSTANLRIMAAAPESVQRAPMPSSNLQHLVLAMEREEFRNNPEQVAIPFTNPREYSTEHRLTETLLRQNVQDVSKLERFYKGAVSQGHHPSPLPVNRTPSPARDRASPVPERVSPAPHPKKDFQRRATPPPPREPTPPPSTYYNPAYGGPPMDLSKLPPKHRVRRLEQPSSVASQAPALAGMPPAFATHHLTLQRPLGPDPSSLPAHFTSFAARQQHPPPPPEAVPQPPVSIPIPLMIPKLLQGQPYISLPRMPLDPHGGTIKLPDDKFDFKAHEALSKVSNIPSIVNPPVVSVKKSQAPAPNQRDVPPHQINPFTFPKSGMKVSPTPTIPSFGAVNLESNSTPPTANYARSRSDITYLRRQEDIKDSNAMPHLVPEKSIKLDDTKFGSPSYQEIEEESKKLKPWTGQFNMRLKNLANFPANAASYRSAYRAQSVAVQRAKLCSITGAGKTLDLLRQTLQKSINKEIDAVIQKYVEKFFNLGIANIKENTGPTSVTDEHLNSVCRQILEESKKMYIVESRRSVSPVRDFPDNVSDTGSNSGKRTLIKKRRLSDSDSEKGSDLSIPRKIKRKGRPHISGRSTPSKIRNIDIVRREGPKWDPERLNLDTLLVMGAKANKALGLGNTRGRLYIKHPDVFKYSGDQEDKQWLYEHHLMPATGGKAYMLIVEDIKDLAETDEYRDGNLLMDELSGFNVPEWMIAKMKAQMQIMRTDRGKVTNRSRSATPSEASLSSIKELDGDDSSKTLPFSNFSDSPLTINTKTENEVSAMDAEMEFLSGAGIGGSNMSPFNLTGGFDDNGSPSQSDIDNLDDDPTYTTPFGLAKD